MPIIGIPSSGGMQPTTPTIGTASDGGTGTTASVAFTPSTYIGKGTITYTATSSPGGFTGTSSSSPITVSGLTTGTAYTFTVYGTTNYGVTSGTSAASNSVTPASPSSYEFIQAYTSSGGSVTFSSIPQTYTHLQVRISGRSTLASGVASDVICRVNGLTTAIYYQNYQGSASNAASNGVITAGTNGFYINSALNTAGGNFTATKGIAILDCFNYSSTTKLKSYNYISGAVNGNSGSTSTYVYVGNVMVVDSTATTSLMFYPASSANFSNTIIALYGIKE